MLDRRLAIASVFRTQSVFAAAAVAEVPQIQNFSLQTVHVATAVSVERMASDGNPDGGGFRQAADVFGLPVTVSQSADVDTVLQHFNTAAEQFVNYSIPPLDAVTKTLAADPELFMAHFIKAAFFGRTNQNHADPKLAAIAKEVTGRVSAEHLNNRERQYAAAYEVWDTGDFDQALNLFEALVRSYPTDLIALRLLHAVYLTLGLSRRMRDCLMGVAFAWDDSMPFYALFLAMYSFALEECHEWESAREKASRALRMRPDAIWAIHAMAHCHEERSPATHGISFLEGSQDKWKVSILGGHIAWHLALYYFDVENMDRVLEIFDTDLIERISSGVIYTLVDTASLLWRLECVGYEVGADRWRRIAKQFEKHIGEHSMAWFDIHLMYALTHSANAEQTSKLLLARKLLESMETYAGSSSGHNASVTRRFGIPVCEGLLDYANGKFDEACQRMLTVQPFALECGWSIAQRQIFLIQLYHVAAKAGDAKVANGTLSTLREMKPYSQILKKLPLL